MRTPDNDDVPFDSALLPATLAAHSLADDAPEDLTVDISPLFDSHLGDDARQLFLLLLRPRASPSSSPIFQMVAPAVTAVAGHTPDDLTDAFPLLTQLVHSSGYDKLSEWHRSRGEQLTQSGAHPPSAPTCPVDSMGVGYAAHGGRRR